MIELIEPFIIFSNTSTIMIWLWLMVFYDNPQSTLRATYLLMSVIIINVWLKALFHISLPYASSTFAFPSGHMHASTAVYGYLAYCSKSYIQKIPLAAIILAIGLAEIQLGYHNTLDILGGFAFAALHITTYHASISAYSERLVMVYLFILCTFVVILHAHETPYILSCWGVMLAQTLAALLPINQPKRSSLLNKTLGLLGSALVGSCCYLIYLTYMPMPPSFETLFYTAVVLSCIYLPLGLTHSINSYQEKS
ncbi:MAG TPA: hypothetical protein QF353_05860 [Gammaproteobacteria bacterium]|nr:hypothetical protein [Gammaproteobacteria bacterium]